MHTKQSIQSIESFSVFCKERPVMFHIVLKKPQTGPSCSDLLFHFIFADLVQSMRQAELCDWALDPAVFTSLCDSLNRFFTQKGMITPGNNSPVAPGAPQPLPAFNFNPPPTLSSLTQPSPLPYSSIAPPANGAQPPRRALPMQGPGLQRPQLTQPASTAGETWT